MLTWTKDKPTVPGWYWVRSLSYGVKIVWVPRAVVADMGNVEYSGPIPEPGKALPNPYAWWCPECGWTNEDRHDIGGPIRHEGRWLCPRCLKHGHDSPIEPPSGVGPC